MTLRSSPKITEKCDLMEISSIFEDFFDRQDGKHSVENHALIFRDTFYSSFRRCKIHVSELSRR